MSFVHLHVHSEYSLLDGYSNIRKLIAKAKKLEMPALALTDHGSMYGVIDFFNAAKEVGIKPIIGIEAYLAARTMTQKDAQYDKKSTHLLLLAENQTGYQNLLQIASAAQLDGFYYVPRIDHDFLASHSEGLICTTGCMSAEIPRMIKNSRMEAAQKQLDWYFDVFGNDHFFFELQSHNIEELEQINMELLSLGKRYGGKFIATNDVHYIEKEDARYQDILLAMQTGSLLSDPKRMRMTGDTYYLRSASEMASIFSELPEAIRNTLQIAERCNIDLSFRGYKLPKFVVPEGHDAQSYLRELCEEGLKKIYGDHADDKVIRDRLEHELDVIHNMHFDAYFLIVWDLCQYARDRDIWYNARGSAAGSIVAYSLDITIVDPLEHGLIFERFLNPGRSSMPDIDLDFRDDRRAEMMAYAADKYGDDKVAQIITFGTMGARAAIRDVGRVFDIPLNEVDRVAKLIPNIPGKPVSIEGTLREVPEFKQLYEDTPYLHDLIDTAMHMEGVVRNVGTHAAGVIITDKPIIEYIPLHRPTGSSATDIPIKTLTQFEMKVVDALGLLKVDFLGLSTLTIMAIACDLIEKRHKRKLHLGNIPTDDPETYALMGRGETAGVFQLEGSGMRRWLIEMKPKSLANVIAMVALFRPGPMEFIPGYIRRMHGEEEVEYRHPRMENIFKETYGYPVYQEQLMFAAMEISNYSASEADDLRKAIAKKIKGKLQKHREKFIHGAKNNGIETSIAAAIFDDWQEFARYGFNKSHAVDYGVIAVQTAYLKTHFPIEYMTALLSVMKNDAAKVSIYTVDCRRMGINVEPPDINVSSWDFSIENCENCSPVIRFGLGAVKNVGQGPVSLILEGRGDQPFNGLNDFAHRVDLRQVGKRALESLIKVGALDEFGDRSALLEVMDRVIAISASYFRASASGQLSLFGEHTGVQDSITLPTEFDQVSNRDRLNWERELLGLYVSDHPLSPVMSEIANVVTHYSSQLESLITGMKVRVVGIVTNIRHHQTRKGKSMGFVSIEDLQGAIELVVFPSVWSRFEEILIFDQIVMIEGRVDNAGTVPKILVDQISKDFSGWVALDDSRNNMQKIDDLDTSYHFEDYDFSVEPNSIISDMTKENNDSIDSSLLVEDEKQDDQDSSDRMHSLPDTPADWFQEEEPQGLSEWENGNVPSNVFGRKKSQTEKDVASITLQDNQEEIISENKKSEEKGNQIRSNSKKLKFTQIDANSQDIQEVSQEAQKAKKQRSDEIIDPILDTYSSVMSSPSLGENEDREARMLTVILRSTKDKTRDVLRIRRIHGIIASYPGGDRFAIHIFEHKQSYLVEFPNLAIGVCPELVGKLELLVGPENIHVETFLIQ